MKKWFLSIFLFISVTGWTQESVRAATTTNRAAADSLPEETPLDTTNFKTGKRKLLIAGIHGTAYAGTLLLLSQAWYKDYPKAGFHTFNDSKEWLQVDKIGHAWTAYNIANYSTDMWKWAGYSHRKAVILGGLSSFGYQTILEVLDAHSAQWGWSWADITANTIGAGLYSVQELAWQEQRMQFKFSSFPQRYTANLEKRADVLYGTSFPERLLKDYNGQTYWLSFNLRSFAKETSLPGWLNVAIGYGAKGLFGGFENYALDKNGNVTFDRRDILRQRQWYLSPDIDFTKIKTRKRLVKTTLSLLNMIKLPAPALSLTDGKLKGHLLHF